MILEEKQMNLFKVPNYYYFAQCISADLAMGAGIALQFNKRFDTKNTILQMYGDSLSKQIRKTWELSSIEKVRLIQAKRVFCLVTKGRYYNIPTYEDLTRSLELLREEIDEQYIKYLAMPRIGCGLDRLKWSEVKPIINSIFADSDVNILVCHLKGENKNAKLL